MELGILTVKSKYVLGGINSIHMLWQIKRENLDPGQVESVCKNLYAPIRVGNVEKERER